MAVNAHDTEPVARASRGRRVLVGTNVLAATLLAAAVVIVIQIIAYNMPWKKDMTSTGVNSLSDGTEHLLRNLDTNVRLTSLYFETDREEEDQPRYRRAVDDLLKLYESNNRAKISTEWINPLKDHEKLQTLQARLAKKKTFDQQIGPYRERLKQFSDELEGKIRSLLQSEVDRLQQIVTSPVAGPGTASPVAPVENLLMKRIDLVEAVSERIKELTLSGSPQYSAAIGELRGFYRDIAKSLKDIGQYGADQVARTPSLSAQEKSFLGEAGARYADLVASVEEQITALQALEPLKLDDLLQELGPTTNPILVETDDDALVVDFSSVWPPLQSGAGDRAGFASRAFKGEEKLTSAILRATHKEQTAVVFVRYGGVPLFLGGFMPGQPQAPYATMKKQLEDANFVVEEWDVKTSDTPPTIDPAPTRTIYVLLKPTPPARGPMGRPSQEPPFGESQRENVMKAIGDDTRALFVAGWYPGPFGAIPATYEYNDYLQKEWGIKVDSSSMLIETQSIGPGKYAVTRRDFFNMHEFETGDHPIVDSPLARQLTLPWCAPLELVEDKPDGVTLHRLVWLPDRDGLWGVKNIQVYQQQLQQRDYLTRADGDITGPFDLAVAAEKEGKKIVVVSARGFATDQVAFARTFSVGPRGFQIRSANPGNVTLLINTLHWLNDNTDFMNIGKPIDAAVLEIGKPSTVKIVQVLTIFIWPALALVGGGMVWWIRRR